MSVFPSSPSLLARLTCTRGIFALPTKCGERGMVLLASLGIDLGGDDAYHHLLGMHHRKEIRLASVPIIETRAALKARGLVLKVNQRDVGLNVLRTGIDAGPETTFHAVLVEAVAATAETLSNDQIEWLWNSREISPSSVLDRHTCLHAMSLAFPSDFQRNCRLACATEWNRRAGITC